MWSKNCGKAWNFNGKIAIWHRPTCLRGVMPDFQQNANKWKDHHQSPSIFWLASAVFQQWCWPRHPRNPKAACRLGTTCCRGHGSSLARRGKAQRRGEGSIMSLCHLEWKTDFWVGSVPFTSIFPKVVLLSREITYLYISWFESVKIHLHRAGCRVSQTLESEKSFVIPYFWTPNFIRKTSQNRVAAVSQNLMLQPCWIIKISSNS